jgi:5-methylphenazine-1-carboxylate 1-monooxygenase
VIDLVEARAPSGFAHLDEVASHAELEAIVKGYSKLAGFDQTQVNRSKEVGMFETSQPDAR